MAGSLLLYIFLQRNRLQVVIVTDGSSTYAVFNYHTVVWDGGYGNGGDAKTGVGADNPPAQVNYYNL